jgi:hypothetical protein
LVTEGTITQSQATAIHNALISYMHDHWQDVRGQSTSDTALPAV